MTVVLPLIVNYPTKSSCVIAGTYPDPSCTEGLVLRLEEGRGIGNPHIDVTYRVCETVCVLHSLLNGAGAHSLIAKLCSA